MFIVNVSSSQRNVIGTMNNEGNTPLIKKIALIFILDIFGQFIGKITIGVIVKSDVVPF